MEIQEIVAVAVNMLHERERVNSEMTSSTSTFASGKAEGLLQAATMLLETVACM